MKKTIGFLIFLISASACYSQEVVVKKATKIETAREIASTFLANEHIPGMAISVSQNDKIIWSEGFGYSDLKQKTKVEPANTQFRLASISKPITAVGLAILVDKGQLDYDESLYTYLPNYPKKKYDFSIRQIGGHIAGIRHYRGTEFISNKKMSIEEGLTIFKDDPLLSEPGTTYKYSTYGWNLLSAVIEEIAKEDFTQFMTRVLFKPLKMHNTVLDLSDQKMPNRTKFYRKTHQNKIVASPEVSNEHKVAGGGFIATSEDLIQFGNEIIDPKLISKKNLNELLTAQKTNDGKSTGYGIGFGINTTKKNQVVYSHSGGGAGATTLLLIYPNENIVIAMVSNLSQVNIRTLGSKLEAVFLD